MNYLCVCGEVFATADKFNTHCRQCQKALKTIAEAQYFAGKYKRKIMEMNMNEASCMAGMALTQCRHLGMSVEQLNQLVSISVSNYEKEVEADK